MPYHYTKLTSAVYGMLDVLSDSDPLKNKAKEKALAILDNAALLFGSEGWVLVKTYVSADKIALASRLVEDIEILENYLAIVRDQGWTTAMNFLIVTKQYATIKEQAKRIKTVTSVVSYLPTSKPVELITTKKEVKKEPLLPPVEKNLKSYSLRQKKILEILKGRQKAQVADIIKELPQVTKRTIRRDLDDLLKSGEIRRIGTWNQIYYQLPDRT